MSNNSQLDMVREAANRPPYKQVVYVNAGQLLAEIEREYLPRPRFENGELVNIGDQFEFDGESFHIRDLHVGLDEKTYIVARERDGLFDMEPGERVKRPEPEVLDDDGVPIKVGDTVYFVGGAEHFDVLGIESNGDVHIGREDGTSTDAWAAPSDLTHKQPDSLECIEEDAGKTACDYFYEGREHRCDDCGGEHYHDCKRDMILDLLHRQREVLERVR